MASGKSAALGPGGFRLRPPARIRGWADSKTPHGRLLLAEIARQLSDLKGARNWLDLDSYREWSEEVEPLRNQIEAEARAENPVLFPFV